MSDAYVALVNRAAGGGRCGKLFDDALQELRSKGVTVEPRETKGPGHATELVQDAYRAGARRFIAVGGDGTSYEIINGLFPQALDHPPPTLGFLPLGTGNSFLRDFSDRGVAYAIESLVADRSRPCDVLRLTHDDGVIYYMNLLSIGFAAAAAVLTDRYFKPLGTLGYLLAVVCGMVRLERRVFPLRVDSQPEWDLQRCLFLSFNNSKYTGGKMLIAPNADPTDGLIEFVRWGPIGRLALIRRLHTLFDGSHIHHPKASRQAVRRVEFDLDEPIDVMIDGEVLRIRCQSLDVLPSAINVVA